MRIAASLSALVAYLYVVAQAPNVFGYQAVARDAGGEVISNSIVGVQFQLRQATSAGVVVFAETHAPMTSALGLFSAEIGNGTSTIGVFSDIDWTAGPYFLEVGIDPAGGSSYSSIGTQQLLSVPYAMYGEDADSDPTNELQSIVSADPNNQIIPGTDGGAFLSESGSYDTTRSLVNDLLLTSTLCNCSSLPPAMVQSLLERGYAPSDLINFRVPISDLLSGGVPVSDLIATDLTPLELFLGGVSLDSLYGQSYQGGLIAFLDTITGTGLIAATGDQSSGIEWWNGSFMSTGATGADIFSGRPNTNLIISVQGPGAYAAALCEGLSIGAYSDWFLPSRDELDQLYHNLHLNGFGDFSAGGYWCSTEITPNTAYVQSFVSGSQSGASKAFPGHVRAIRAFDIFSIRVQERLNNGETPKEIYDSGVPVDSLYGKTYQGGLIAYLNTATGAGLLAAPSDQSTGMAWWNGSLTVTGATGTGILTGQSNTNLIISTQGTGTYAATLCDGLTIGAYSDWFMPSRDELELLYLNLYQNGLGSFVATGYWSSTELSNSVAQIQSFADGLQTGASKVFSAHVRAIRSF